MAPETAFQRKLIAPLDISGPGLDELPGDRLEGVAGVAAVACSAQSAITALSSARLAVVNMLGVIGVLPLVKWPARGHGLSSAQTQHAQA